MNNRKYRKYVITSSQRK